jgi:hypothetical protein
MPEKDMTLDQMLTQAAGGTAATTAEEKTIEGDGATQAGEATQADGTLEEDVNTGSDETTEEDETSDDDEAAEDENPKKKPDKKKPNPMKEVRDRYNTEKQMREKIDTLINKFTTGDYSFKLKDFSVDGKLDYEGLEAAMSEADNKVKAEARGVSPEVQAEIDRIEREKLELEREKLRVSMDRALTDLQLERSIKSAEINKFFKDSMAAGKNPYTWLAQGGSLNDLYDTIYRDNLIQNRIDTAVAEARAKWEEDANRKNRVHLPNPARSTPDRSTDTGEGVSMDKLLAEAASKRRR